MQRAKLPTGTVYADTDFSYSQVPATMHVFRLEYGNFGGENAMKNQALSATVYSYVHVSVSIFCMTGLHIVLHCVCICDMENAALDA